MPDYTSAVLLLERDHPIEVLQSRADGAAAGAGGLVLLAGEAGIGKTALLRHTARQASGFQLAQFTGVEARSEERRVGKECA